MQALSDILGSRWTRCAGRIVGLALASLCLTTSLEPQGPPCTPPNRSIYSYTETGQFIQIGCVIPSTGAISSNIFSPAFSGTATGTSNFLPITLFNSGSGASGSTFWRGDGTWAAPASGITEGIIEFNDNSGANCPTNGTVLSTLNACSVRWFWTNTHTLTRFRILLGTSAGCTTPAVISIKDLTSSSILTSLTQVNGTQIYDSGTLNISTTAGHSFGLGITTLSIGCTTTPDVIQSDATYQ